MATNIADILVGKGNHHRSSFGGILVLVQPPTEWGRVGAFGGIWIPNEMVHWIWWSIIQFADVPDPAKPAWWVWRCGSHFGSDPY